jgi:uncharacterized membrane protein
MRRFLAVAFVVSGGDIFSRMGNLTVWSVAFFLCTLVYAFASVAGSVTVWRAQHAVRAYVRTYSPAVILALLFSTAYLVYWGIIGLRTWA